MLINQNKKENMVRWFLEIMYLLRRTYRNRTPKNRKTLTYHSIYLFTINKLASIGEKECIIICDNKDECAILAVRLLCRRLNLKLNEQKSVVTTKFIIHLN